ncbi:MAG: hypothetical protein RXO36_07085 [Candidatus Nanopusillus acidilobi]
MFEIYFNIGKFLVEDDIKDLGRYSFDGHPSPIHHWQWGVLLMLGSVIGEMALMVADIVDQLQKQNNGGVMNGKASNEST